MSEPKIPTAYSLTDRILSGLLVHGFENDADIEAVLRQHVPIIEAVLVPVVAAAKSNTDRIAALEAENARLRAVAANNAASRHALTLALEYWSHRQQRYKNRHPAWVVAGRAALEEER